MEYLYQARNKRKKARQEMLRQLDTVQLLLYVDPDYNDAPYTFAANADPSDPETFRKILATMAYHIREAAGMYNLLMP